MSVLEAGRPLAGQRFRLARGTAVAEEAAGHTACRYPGAGGLPGGY